MFHKPDIIHVTKLEVLKNLNTCYKFLSNSMTSDLKISPRIQFTSVVDWLQSLFNKCQLM